MLPSTEADLEDQKYKITPTPIGFGLNQIFSVQLVLAHNGKESLFDLDQAQYSAQRLRILLCSHVHLLFVLEALFNLHSCFNFAI